MVDHSVSYGYIVAPVLAFATAQIIKTAIEYRRIKRLHISQLFKSGNMPSGHTATMTALLSVMWLTNGMSELFAITLVISILTIYDSLVARRSVGEQGTALLRLLERSPFSKDPMPRVALGHKPLEVIAGGVLGVLMGTIVAFFITT